MSRWSLAFVAFWAMALTMRDGASVSTPPVSAPPAVEAALAMDGEAVGRIVGSWNPALSGIERERIGTAVMGCHERYELDPTLVTAMIECAETPGAIGSSGPCRYGRR